MIRGSASGDDVIASPNIWSHPDIYEAENRGVDPDGSIDATIAALLGPDGWRGRVVLDVGCGAGFHLPAFAAAPGVARVVGVEPHGHLADRARRRVAALPAPYAPVEVLAGTAQALPLPDAVVDVIHARWAYFFGPGCEPGLAEAARVARPGALMVVVDTDASRSTFGGWFARAVPGHDPAAVARFWRRQGFSRERLDVRWQMPDRATFEAVLRIELPPAVADAAIATHPGTGVDAAVDVYWRRW